MEHNCLGREPKSRWSWTNKSRAGRPRRLSITHGDLNSSFRRQGGMSGRMKLGSRKKQKIWKIPSIHVRKKRVH